MNKRAESTTKEAEKTTTKKTTAKTTAKKTTTAKAATTKKASSAAAKPTSAALSTAVASQSLPGGIVIPTTTAATVSGVAASPTPSIDPNASTSASSGLSGGAIGGIIGGVAVAAIGVGAFAFIRNKRKSKSAAPNYRRSMRQSMADPFSMGFVGANKPPQPMPLQDNPFPPAAPYERLEEPKSLGVYNVVSTYTPTLGDEIDIRSGDRIRVLVEYDDGWMLGENISNGDAKGVFPRHCIDYPGNESYIQPAYTAEDQNRPDSMLHVGDNRRSKRISSLYSATDMK
ncbi:unnamed protein product [Umbelopsis ramanniana]